MSSKRKWDQAAPADVDSPAKAPKTEEGKTASEAAAAAAAIAAKIAAQFANPSTGTSLGPRDPHDGDFTHDIDINDVRNRYLLTKGSTQSQVRSLIRLHPCQCCNIEDHRFMRKLVPLLAQRVSGTPTALKLQKKILLFTFTSQRHLKRCCKRLLTKLTNSFLWNLDL